jgi:DNA-binding CsgD family transcriptional regulator
MTQSQLNSAHRTAAILERGPLTARQLECLYWAQQGKSATDIGQIVGISGRTVERHLFNACAALGVRTRVQAVVRARDLGWIPRDAPTEAVGAAPRSFRR